MARSPSFPIVILSRPFDAAFRKNPKAAPIEILAVPLDLDKAKVELKRLQREHPQAAMIGRDEFSAELYREFEDLKGSGDVKLAKERGKLTTRIQRAYKKEIKARG